MALYSATVTILDHKFNISIDAKTRRDLMKSVLDSIKFNNIKEVEQQKEEEQRSRIPSFGSFKGL